MLRGRREFLLLSAGILGAGLAGSARTPGRSAPVASRGGSPRSAGLALFDELGITPGMRFAGSIVDRVGPELFGGVPIRLTDEQGMAYAVAVLRHDPATPGIARGGTLSVFVSNDGDGKRATVEAHGLAAMEVARHLERREAAGVAPPQLVTLSEREELRRRHGRSREARRNDARGRRRRG